MDHNSNSVNGENFQFTFSIDTWEKETDENDSKNIIINYKIDIQSQITNNKWSVFKTVNDFNNLLDNIFKTCLNLPPRPHFFYLKETGDTISQIGKDFEKFIKSIIHRGDVYNNKVLSKFFELNKHFDKINKFLPQISLVIPDFKLQISDILFYEEENLLIVSCAKKSNKNFIEKYSFYSKLTSMLQKSNYGEILIYKMTHLFNKYIKIFSLETKSEISSLTLVDNHLNKKLLLVGYFDATVEIFEVDPKSAQQGVISTTILKKILSIKMHDKNYKIISLGINKTTNFLYAACEKDNEIKVGNIIKKERVCSLQVSFDNLCGFSYDSYTLKNTNRFIAFDIKGRLSIGVISNDNSLINLEYVIICDVYNATLFKFDYNEKFIYIGNFDGKFNLFSIEDNKEDDSNKLKFAIMKINLRKKERKLTDVVELLNSSYCIKDALFNPKKKILFLAMQNGLILVFSHSKDNPEIVIEENGCCINKIINLKDFEFLLSGGVDNKITIYTLPKYFFSEMTRKNQETNIHQVLVFEENVKNEINFGYSKTTELMKEKSFIETHKLSKLED